MKISKTVASNRQAASALLLTVMIISILTTTTLASIAVRFDQLASTDKIANAAVAKSAADSALVKLKEKLATGTVGASTTLEDLDTNTESTVTTTPFRPNPRKIVATYQKAQTALPRCLAVAALIPWTNDGQYQMGNDDGTNPVMIFNYANIVNDTPLGMIPGNGSLSTADKSTTLSQLTNMGHFYNPYAPAGSYQGGAKYWTIKLGGPQDQFLTRKGTDGVSSYYKNIDFFYLPYLPRWQDSGLFTSTPGTGVDRTTAAGLQSKFETTVKSNNFKIWLDASATDAQIAQYGFGDLFTNSTDSANYRLKWLQPSLWNDAPETSLMAPYRADDTDAATLSWNKQSQPLMTLGSNDPGWNTAIIKGSKSFSFIKLGAGQGATQFAPGNSVRGLIYGSLEGIRLNQNVTLALLGSNLQPVPLVSRGQDQGRLYSVNFTAIGPTTTSNGIDTINVTFKLSASAYDTPQLNSNPTPRTVVGNDIGTIVVLAGPQNSTGLSNQNVTITADADGNDVTINLSSSCVPTAGSLSACPAVGDIVDLTKTGSTPVWGKVTKTNFSALGTSLTSIVVDQLHKSPPPVREMASTAYTSVGSPRIAYYGGAVDMNDYDGGYASESKQLWLYDPENDVWTFVTPASGVNPGPRAGASMVYDSLNNRLVMVGGYYHESIISDPNNTTNCQLNQSACLYTNQPGMRIAKRVTNDVYAYNLGTNTWEKLDYSAGWGKIQTGVTYTARVTSTLADRSGLERWNYQAKNPAGVNQTLKVDGTASTVTLYPSAAGVAKGDQVYLYGNKASDGSTFYGWGKVNSVDFGASTANITEFGYQPAGGETQVVLSTLAVQVLNRSLVTNSCVGGFDGTYYSCAFNSSGDTTGYAVGDSVVLEQYAAADAQLTGSLSGFISYIDSAGKAYFVADERNAAINDFYDRTVGKVAGDSAVAFPSARYGAAFDSNPATANVASYWEGAAKNVNYNNRFADLWTVQFVAGSGPNSAVWSFQTTTNTIDTASLNSKNAYNFQVVRPNYTYQIATTNNPDVLPNSSGVWDDGGHWLLGINGALDAGKVVTGAWVTMERRLTVGTRQTFHGIIDDMYSGIPGCGAYDVNKICVRHNPAYGNDSGLNNSAIAVKLTMTPSFRTDTATPGTYQADTTNGLVNLSNVPSSKLGMVPGVGAMVQIWRNSGTFPANDYTFIINSRTYSAGKFSFSYDKLTASPDPYSFSSSQISSQGGTDRIVTITDSQMNGYDTIGAPEWIKDTASGGWQIRQSGKYSNYLYRPSNRRAAGIASLYDSVAQTTKTYLVGGTLGNYPTLWRQQNSGSTVTNAAAWDPRLVTADASHDLPDLAGGSLTVYKVGSSTRAVFFGGKQKYDYSSADYGRSNGPYVLGRPDSAASNVTDNSYFADNAASSGTDAQAFVKTIENNLPTTRPAGIDNSLSLVGGSIAASSPAVCAYLGQATGCSSKELLSQLGDMGRDSQADATHNGWTYGRSSVFDDLGTAFKQQAVGGTAKPSLIMSIPSLSGTGLNGRYDEEGYRPYLTDTGLPYGKLATDFTSGKTAALAAFAAISGGGAVLATSASIGSSIVNNRGGSTGTTLGWYSYCAASEINKDANGSPILQGDGTYSCQASAKRYLSWLPDAEDLLFTLNASIALAATDTYKVVGYYGGVKRGYLVISRSGSQPTVYEIAP